MNRFWLLAAAFLLLAFSCAASPPYHIRHLTEKQLLRAYDDLLWDGLKYADRDWHAWNEDPRAGMWGTGRSDNVNEGIRAIAEMVFVCGTLNKYSTVGTKTDRDVYRDKALAATRYSVASHVSGTRTCTDGKHWGNSWQSALWTGTLAWGAWLMWDELDAVLRKDVERVVAFEADRFLSGKPPAGSFNDTKAEENGWNLTCISVAANLFPNHPHAAAWHEKVLEYMMNTLSAPQDARDSSLVDGKPVRDWFCGANVHPDFTLENHGFFHPAYIGCSSYFLTQTAMHFTFAHQTLPQAATHHLLDTWNMLANFILPNGEVAYPQGMDWELHGIPYINLFAAFATSRHDPRAATLEKRYVQYMRTWQQMEAGSLATPGSSLGFTRHAICAEQAAYGLLAHKLFGPAVPQLEDSAVAKIAAGVREYPYIQLITHRTRQKFVSFSWTNRLMGMVIPIGSGHEENPDFTVPLVNGLIGSFELAPRGDTGTIVKDHRSEQTTDRFETTGTLWLNGGRLEQKLKLLSVGEQTVLYEDCVTARSNVTIIAEHGVPLAIENDKITGGKRIVFTAHDRVTCDWQHPRPGFAIPNTWANIDNRLGIVAVKSSGLHYAQATSYARGMSVYPDMLYGSFSSARRDFKPGDLVARRIIVLYVETDATDTARLARQISLKSKDGIDYLHFKEPSGPPHSVAL